MVRARLQKMLSCVSRSWKAARAVSDSVSGARLARSAPARSDTKIVLFRCVSGRRVRWLQQRPSNGIGRQRPKLRRRAGGGPGLENAAPRDCGQAAVSSDLHSRVCCAERRRNYFGEAAFLFQRSRCAAHLPCCPDGRAACDWRACRRARLPRRVALLPVRAGAVACRAAGNKPRLHVRHGR